MSSRDRRIAITDRDRALFALVFENRVMAARQIGTEVFLGLTQQTIFARLNKLTEYGYLERRHLRDHRGKVFSVFLNTPAAIREARENYRHGITKEYCKSDSVEHDVQLVDLRRRIESLPCVKTYFTENMLQACGNLSESENLAPFVENNTDAVIEILKNGKKITIGLEYERSEKAFERYTRKLVSYHSDFRSSIIFYICASPRIREIVARAESEIVGKSRPRCFFAMSEDVLRSGERCTFANLKGDTITLQ